MEMEEDNVPSVGNTEEVPNEAPQEFCEPLIESGIPTNDVPETPPAFPESSPTLSPNVKYLFCKYCPYKTRFVGNLTKHVRTHTGEKPFSCRHCGKRFASRSNLNYHEATHTGNKRFQCFISGCQFKTQLRDSLNSHMRKIHGVLMQQNSTTVPNFASPPGEPLHSPPTGPGIPVFSPITSISNLPPIQDILTSPPAVAGISSSLHSTLPSMTSPVDVKPSVAELAQYMIALHEGTTPNNLGKPEARPRTASVGGSNPVPFSTTGEYNAVKPAPGEDGFATSPVTVETDTESNQDSPRVSQPAPPTPQQEAPPPPPPPVIKQPWESPAIAGAAASAGPIQNSPVPPAMIPRLAPTHPLSLAAPNPLKTPVRSNSAELVTTALTGEPPKSSALSGELLKIFQNLGLDTMAILELLAAQGRLHICRSCNIVFPEYSTFVLHRGCHGNEGPFQCHFCQRRFPEKFGFLTHFMQCPYK